MSFDRIVSQASRANGNAAFNRNISQVLHANGNTSFNSGQASGAHRNKSFDRSFGQASCANGNTSFDRSFSHASQPLNFFNIGVRGILPRGGQGTSTPVSTVQWEQRRSRLEERFLISKFHLNYIKIKFYIN